MKVNKPTKPTKHFAENFVYDTISANEPKEESSSVTAVLGPGDADALKQHDDNVKAERERKKKAYSEPAMKKISAEPNKKIKELQDTIKGKKTISIPAMDKSSIHKIIKELEGLGYTRNGKTKGYTIRRSKDESLYREIYLTDLDESVDDPIEDQKDTAQYICFDGDGHSIYDMAEVCATLDDAKEYAKTHPEVKRIERSYTIDGLDTQNKVVWKRKTNEHLKNSRSSEHLNTRRGKHSHKELIEHLHSKKRRIKESSHQYDLSDGVFSLSDSDFQELLDIVCDELPYWSGFEDEDGRELLDFFEIKRDDSYDDREPVALLLSYYVSGESYDQHGYAGARELLGISDDDDEDRYDLIDCKSVPGEDGGPVSEYNLYYDAETDQYFTQLGDSDYYPADIENAEKVFDNLVDAQEWFDSHTGTEKTEESFDIHTYKPEIATRSLWEEIVKKNKVDDLQFFLESSFDNKPTANDLSRLLADKDYVRDILELDKDKEDIKASPTFEESLANEVTDNKIREDYEKDANPLVEPLEDEFNCYDPSLN